MAQDATPQGMDAVATRDGPNAPRGGTHSGLLARMQAPVIRLYRALCLGAFPAPAVDGAEEAAETGLQRLWQFSVLCLLAIPPFVPVPYLVSILPGPLWFLVTLWVIAVLFFLASVDRAARKPAP